MKDDIALLLDLLEKREMRGREELALKLAQIKRECSPAFAERVETSAQQRPAAAEGQSEPMNWSRASVCAGDFYARHLLE